MNNCATLTLTEMDSDWSKERACPLIGRKNKNKETSRHSAEFTSASFFELPEKSFEVREVNYKINN